VSRRGLRPGFRNEGFFQLSGYRRLRAREPGNAIFVDSGIQVMLAAVAKDTSLHEHGDIGVPGDIGLLVVNGHVQRQLPVVAHAARVPRSGS
jgi:hypothetical protein